MAAHPKKAREQKARLVFIDESGFFLNPLVRRTWAPRGQTPLLRRFGRHRDKVSTIAALSVSPQLRHLGLHWRTDPKNYVDAAAVVRFLADLLTFLPGKVIVVWDNGSNHRGELLREFLTKGAGRRLHLECLPPYAPELNPVEWVWAHVKHGRLANFVPHHVRHLERVVQGHLLAVGKAPGLLKALWRGSELPFPTKTALLC